jgi:glycosyltransferase involved in cell wall biosynthesis
MIRKYLYPLISCICVTARRPDFLLKAIIYFDTQNYPNRELVISYPLNDLVTKNLIKTIMANSTLRIIVVEREEDLTLGMARNEAIANCNGEYICIWDDDDWYREVRLMYQFTILRSVRQKREASILTQIILYDRIGNQISISDPIGWPGTLLCRKEIVLAHPYMNTNYSEGADLLKYLEVSQYLHYYDEHNIYGFIYHGGNVVTQNQFSGFLKDKLPLNQSSKDWFIQQANKKAELVTT